MATVTKTGAQTWLGNVADDKKFWCNDGRVMVNMQELGDALAEMSDDTYRYHANDSKNDFANWVRDVIGDDRLAAALLRSNDRSQAARAISDRIRELKRRK